jgi:hypothetical protein
MPRPWSQERKQAFAALRAAGKNAGAIARALGLPRQTVIERIAALRTFKRNAAIIAAGLRKRAQLRQARARAALRTMTRALKVGADRDAAMLRAYESGATWREIGASLKISTAAASQRGRSARARRGRGSPKMHGSKWRGRIGGR